MCSYRLWNSAVFFAWLHNFFIFFYCFIQRYYGTCNPFLTSLFFSCVIVYRLRRPKKILFLMTVSSCLSSTHASLPEQPYVCRTTSAFDFLLYSKFIVLQMFLNILSLLILYFSVYSRLLSLFSFV